MSNHSSTVQHAHRNRLAWHPSKGVMIALCIVVSMLMIAAIWLVNFLYFKPFSINQFFDRVVLIPALQNPEALSRARLFEPYGIKFHQDELNDFSEQQTDRDYARLHREYHTLTSYEDQQLNQSELLSKRILLDYMETQLAGERFRYHGYALNQVFGLQSQLPTFMIDYHLIENKGDAEDYIARLSKFPLKLAQLQQHMEIQRKRDILPPRFILERVIDEMRHFADAGVDDNVLLSDFNNKIAALDLNEKARQTLEQSARTSIEGAVIPAYQRLIQYCESLLDESTSLDGVWHLPDGDAYYRYMLKVHTTTDMSPEEIHKLGLDEVARLKSLLLESLYDFGIDTEHGLATAIRALHDDPRVYYPTPENATEETALHRQILSDYQHIIDEISANLGDYFYNADIGPVIVKPIPEFKQSSSPEAYYHPPSFDGSIPGTFYVNLRDTEAYSRVGMRTLAYHEAVPGHHYQISHQLNLENLPFFRKLSPFTAFIEGWALYAEQLAWEAGFQSAPMDNIGRLQSELFRAARLVVDTGIHHRRWTRHQAIDYMLENTGMDETIVTAEVERYIAMPGQATAYKVGMMKILALREHAQQALQDNFDIREFHRFILNSGALPLTILEQEVERFIALQKASGPH